MLLFFCELARLGGTVWPPADASFDFLTWLELGVLFGQGLTVVTRRCQQSLPGTRRAARRPGTSPPSVCRPEERTANMLMRAVRHSESSPEWIPRKCGFDVTSVRRQGHVESVKVEQKFHLECKLRFPCAQLMLRQMHRTDVSLSIKA